MDIRRPRWVGSGRTARGGFRAVRSGDLLGGKRPQLFEHIPQTCDQARDSKVVHQIFMQPHHLPTLPLVTKTDRGNFVRSDGRAKKECTR